MIFETGTKGNINVNGLNVLVSEAWARYDTLCEEIAETFRNIYRDAWNLPYLKEVLANSSQLMLPGGCDISCGFDIWKNTHEQRVVSI